jgi:hypothetical protein
MPGAESDLERAGALVAGWADVLAAGKLQLELGEAAFDGGFSIKAPPASGQLFWLLVSRLHRNWRRHLLLVGPETRSALVAAEKAGESGDAASHAAGDVEKSMAEPLRLPAARPPSKQRRWKKRQLIMRLVDTLEETAKAIVALHSAVRPRGHIGRLSPSLVRGESRARLGGTIPAILRAVVNIDLEAVRSRIPDQLKKASYDAHEMISLGATQAGS